MKVEIEVYTNEVMPEEDRDICFYFNGKWEKGMYLQAFFWGQEYNHKTFIIKASPDHIELWYYLPERDIFE